MLHLLKKAEKLHLSPQKKRYDFLNKIFDDSAKGFGDTFFFCAVFAPRQNASLSICGFDVG